MNVERLLKVADMIEAFPENFNMSDFCRLEDPEAYADLGPEWSELDAVICADLTAGRACGTTACIAGWAVHLWPAETDPPELIDDAAMRILDLGDDDGLFYGFTFSDRTDAAFHAARIRAYVTAKAGQK